jgi:4,5-DOPA dioxygenase extradiol
MERMPALFIGHGSPMNIILNNPYTQYLEKLGRELPRPEAVLVVSAHWLTEETCITSLEDPPQIYDFYGFRASFTNCGIPQKDL